MAPPRSRRNLASSSRSTSCPSSQAAPAATRATGGRSPMIAKPVSDLPDPLSPTMASVSPPSTSNETSRTGRTGPDGVSISIVRPRTSQHLAWFGRSARRKRLEEPTNRAAGPAVCGSTASRSASQSAFIARIVRLSARQGQSSSKGAWPIVARAAPIIRPQDGAGGTTPSPRKERPDSSTTAEATARLNWTRIGPPTFGSIVAA